jgi:uncharacterized protein YdaU (DUF1376 family)
MAELPYMPVMVNDAIADTSDLTNEELGALQRIMWAMWKAGGLVDEARLSRFARAGSRWGTIAPAVLSKLKVESGKVSHAGLLTMLDLTRQRRRKRAEAAGQLWITKADRGLNSKADPRLTSSKPLKSHETGHANAAALQGQTRSNHNHNKNLSSYGDKTARANARGNAAGPASEKDRRSPLYSRGRASHDERPPQRA